MCGGGGGINSTYCFMSANAYSVLHESTSLIRPIVEEEYLKWSDRTQCLNR